MVHLLLQLSAEAGAPIEEAVYDRADVVATWAAMAAVQASSYTPPVDVPAIFGPMTVLARVETQPTVIAVG